MRVMKIEKDEPTHREEKSAFTICGKTNESKAMSILFEVFLFQFLLKLFILHKQISSISEVS